MLEESMQAIRVRIRGEKCNCHWQKKMKSSKHITYEQRSETKSMTTMMSMSVSVRAMIFHFIVSYLRRIAAADSPYLYHTRRLCNDLFGVQQRCAKQNESKQRRDRLECL